MMIHDFTGPQGPIEQIRFQFYFGPECFKQYRNRLIDDPFLSPPDYLFYLTRDKDKLARQVEIVNEALTQGEQRLKLEIETYYCGIQNHQLIELFSPNPPRAPRVYILTSRFTTVLQHSARQAAEGFEHHGWHTKVVLEPTDYHRMPLRAVLHGLETFKPDLIFLLNQLLNSLKGAIPP